MTSPNVLIIGGGVAGSSCALQLCRRGISATLVDRAQFPRPKVCGCCIGGAGLSALESLAVREWVLERGRKIHRWCGSMAGRTVELELPQGVAISRLALDTELLRRAGQAGTDVRTKCSARIDASGPESVQVTLTSDGDAGSGISGSGISGSGISGSGISGSGESGSGEYSAVVLAAGLNAGGITNMLPWRESPHGPFGAAYTVTCPSFPDGVIHMSWDDDGYVGLVQLEDGRIDVAAALASGAQAAAGGTPRERIDKILARSEFPAWEMTNPSDVMTTPPLRRRRLAGNGRVVAIGDAAGYVEPFTGEGMTWAIWSGIAAAELIADSIADLPSIGRLWDARYRSLQRTSSLVCRVVTSVLRRPIPRAVVARSLQQWPGLADPVLRHLGRVSPPLHRQGSIW